MFDATNVKNRIDSKTTDFKNGINSKKPNFDYDPAGSARNVAEQASDRVVELATGIPKRAHEKFVQAFEEAFGGLCHYMEMMCRAYSEGFGHMTSVYENFQMTLRNDDPEMAAELGVEAVSHIFNGGFDLLVANNLSIPLTTALHAGIDIITGTVTLGTLAEFAFPLITIIAIGYAVKKVKEVSTSKMERMVEDALDRVPGFHAVSEDEDGDYACDRCDETFDVPLHLAQHVALEHRTETDEDGNIEVVDLTDATERVDDDEGVSPA